MSTSAQLSTQRTNTIINGKSKKQEKALDRVLKRVQERLLEDVEDIQLRFSPVCYHTEVVDQLVKKYPNIPRDCMTNTFMRPDGGILSLRIVTGEQYPILISEMKAQGTNELRMSEGKKKQAQGNVVERLGKNVIGLQAYLCNETIFPFICFGDGCDFEVNSSILDRVAAISKFKPLNTIHLHDEDDGKTGTYCFRKSAWTEEEMETYCYSIAYDSIQYYLAKYGRDNFKSWSAETPEEIEKKNKAKLKKPSTEKSLTDEVEALKKELENLKSKEE